MFPITKPYDEWRKNRQTVFYSLIMEAEELRSRDSTPSDPSFLVQKWALILFGLIELIYKHIFPTAALKLGENGNDYQVKMENFIRNNDKEIMRAVTKLLDEFENELLVVESLGEGLDVLGLLGGEEFVSEETISARIIDARMRLCLPGC